MNIENRIKELNKESQDLFDRKQKTLNLLNQIEARLLQIQGAISELKTLKENDKDKEATS